MKLNWFSPVAPAPTAIANFTERVMASLREHFEVTVWTDVENFEAASLPGVEVRSCRDLDRIWPEINFADFSIYNIGNDARFHGFFSSMLERHPGIVVLHDFNLHELHRERLIHQANGLSIFNRYVLEIGGMEALKSVLAFQSHEISFEEVVERVPLVESVTRFATGIISFNSAMRDSLQSITKVPLLLCPLPLEAESELPPVTIHHYTKGRPVELAMFGFLNSPNRRLTEVLEAISVFKPHEVRLTLFGHIKNRDAFDAQVRQLGITANIRYLGYLSEEAMGQALKESHIAINLRNPTRGESSDALLRAWKYSLPVLVSNTGYYATVPSELVCLVDPGDEVKGLRRHIRGFLQDSGSYLEKGEKAHQYFLENHTAGAFAESMAAFLGHAESRRGKRFVFPASRRLGGIIERDFPNSYTKKQLQERLCGELIHWIGEET